MTASPNNKIATSAIFTQIGKEVSNQPLVCIATNVQINADGSGTIGRIAVTPSGNIVVSDVHPRLSVALAMRAWDCAKLDDIAASYFYATRGQAFRVIDALAKSGYLTYNDEEKFISAINCNLRTADFIPIWDEV